MNYRLRQILPPRWAVFTFMAIFLIQEWMIWGLRRLDIPPEENALFGSQRMLICIGYAMYGFFRAIALHPVARPEYLNWLKSTPWRVNLPLPMGPPLLVAQDAIVLFVGMAAVFYYVPAKTFEPLGLYLSFYLLGAVILLLVLNHRRTAYLLIFGLALVIRLWADPWLCVPVILAFNTIAYFALRHTLREFPWEDLDVTKVQNFYGQYRQPASAKKTVYQVGWPMFQLKPHDPGPVISFEDAAAIALLTGWCLNTAFSFKDEVFLDLITALSAMACIAIPAGRLITYVMGHRPPINIWGRIFTGRWIIPGYDRVILVPLATALLATAMWIGLDRIGTPLEFLAPATVTVVLFLTLNLPPTRTQWRLTASHRIAPPIFQSQHLTRI